MSLHPKNIAIVWLVKRPIWIVLAPFEQSCSSHPRTPSAIHVMAHHVATLKPARQLVIRNGVNGSVTSD